MDIFLILLGFIFLLAGLVGAFLPVLPGPPLAYLSLLIIHFTARIDLGSRFLWIMGLLAIIITLLDYYIPVYGTKKFGGSKAASTGSMIGLIVGVIVLPLLGIALGPFGLFGIILGPFVGAYAGESIAGSDSDKAMKVAFGSFIGFVGGTFMKFIFGLVCGFYFFKEVIGSFF
jgi:uncharacterized protein